MYPKSANLKMRLRSVSTSQYGMRSLRILLSRAILLACSCGLAQDKPTPAPISSAAADYLNHALDLVQQYALHRREIDWASVRKDAILRAQGAQTPSDTYPGIFFALAQLREHHSFLRIPDNLSEEQKRKLRVAREATLKPPSAEEVSRPMSPFRNRTVPEGHLIHFGSRVYAWVSVPSCGAKHAKWEDNLAAFRDYAISLHTIAAGLEESQPSGWIIDLRGNGGGSMWPMLAGIGFVLGEGGLGYFVDGDGTEVAWTYRDGSLYVENTKQNNFNLAPPLRLPRLPSVAVLIDSDTASSGEAVAVAFEGRPGTRLFGTHTFGLASSNEMLPLSDGATLFLNDAVDADRNHHRYENGIEPDVAFAVPASQPAENADMALQAALSWLSKKSRVPAH